MVGDVLELVSNGTHGHDNVWVGANWLSLQRSRAFSQARRKRWQDLYVA